MTQPENDLMAPVPTARWVFEELGIEGDVVSGQS